MFDYQPTSHSHNELRVVSIQTAPFKGFFFFFSFFSSSLCLWPTPLLFFLSFLFPAPPLAAPFLPFSPLKTILTPRQQAAPPRRPTETKKKENKKIWFEWLWRKRKEGGDGRNGEEGPWRATTKNETKRSGMMSARCVKRAIIWGDAHRIDRQKAQVLAVNQQLKYTRNTTHRPISCRNFRKEMKCARRFLDGFHQRSECAPSENSYWE